MYSWELENFINERNKRIGGDDLELVIDVKKHPQINHIVTSNRGRNYKIELDDYYPLEFEAMPINEAIEKGLVRKRTPLKR